MFERVDCMSLQPKGSKNTIEKQDAREFVAGVFFQDIYETLPKENRNLFGISKMREVRNQWGKDFANDPTTLADFKRLASLLPSESVFDQARAQLNDADYIRRSIANGTKRYNDYVSKGLYPVTVLDPQLRNVDGMKDLRKFLAVTKGRSLRSVEPGESLPLFSTRGVELYTPSRIAAPIVQDAIDDMNDPTKVVYTGWTSSDGKPGLDNVLGAYFSQSDQQLLSKRMDGANPVVITQAEVDAVYNSEAVLKHLRSNGIEFSIKDSANAEPDKIEVKLNVNNFDLRVFDRQKQYIGRVFDGYGSYYMSSSNQQKADELDWTEDDALATLEVLMGQRKGVMRKAGSKSTSQIRGIEGMKQNRWIQANMLQDRYDALVYNDEAEAKQFVETAILGAGAYFDDQFKFDALMAAYDSPDADAALEAVFSKDDIIRDKQEGFLNDIRILSDMANAGMDDVIPDLLQSVDPKDIDMNLLTNEPHEMAELVHNAIHNELVGSYEEGFNPSFVIDHAPQDEKRQHTRNALLGALRKTDYDLDKLKGNAFATQNIKDSLVKFDPDNARTIDEVDDEFLKQAMQRVQDNLDEIGVIGENGEGKPVVRIDDKGIIEWQGHRMLLPKSKVAKKDPSSLKVNGNFYEETLISGEIGQIFSPNERGIIKTEFGSGADYGIVPGYTGYFKFDGDYGEDRMENFRVKGFEQHLNEKIDTLVRNQVLRPIKPSWENIPNAMDGSGLNSLYHGDVYGRRIELDFVEKSNLNSEATQAIITTLRNRVRFDNQYSDYATTGAETRAQRDKSHENEGAFSYWKAVGEKNMRVLHDDFANIADLTMTGTGKTQGLIVYLVDGAKVEADGKVQRSAGTMNLDGTIEPDKTALKKLDYFKHEDFNAWDRVQMSANQLMTAVHVDEKVGTALMSFGGWTFDDSYVVSQDFAERNQVFGSKPNEESIRKLDEVLHYMESLPKFEPEEALAGTGMKWTDEVLAKGLELRQKSLSDDKEERKAARIEYQEYLNENGRFRPLKRGDKVSDFGGNKGTIGIVIDRNMKPEEAKKLKLEREVAIFKANPELDVVGAPYSMLSRHNAGVVQELMEDGAKDIVDPISGEVYKGAMGKLNMIVTDLTVDEKTHAYSDADVADGKGRKASGQLAWALQSRGANGILNEIYGNNVGPWSSLREYMIATGLDLEEDGTMRVGYQAHGGTEIRNVLSPDDYETSADFLNDISDKGGFLEVPFDMEFKTGNKTREVPVLSAALRQNTELIDGRMRRSDFNNHYMAMFDAIKQYEANKDPFEIDIPESFENDAARNKHEAKLQKMEEKRVKDKKDAMSNAQKAFDGIQNEIIDRQFNGGHNGKHSLIRDKIMGRRMKNSATGVAVVDPRLDIGEAGMDNEMMAALDVKEGDTVMAWRDPVWRDGAIRAFTVVKDDTVHGIAINPIADKSHDMDFDGDTMGIVKLETKQATQDLIEKFSHANNMIDLGSGKGDLYFQSGMDLASAEHKATTQGDNEMTELMEAVKKNAVSEKPALRKKALKDLTTYSHKGFREHGFGGDYVDLTSRETQFESFKAMVDKGAKGSAGKLQTYQDYFDGKKTREDAKKIQYATGIKSDDTGLAGAVSQQLVSMLRNTDIKAALELAYPVTQGTLQIKHDAEHAVTVNSVLANDLPNLYKGKSANGRKKNMTTNSWKRQMADVLENKLEVSINHEYLDTVAKALSTRGIVQPVSTVMAQKGSPMDQIAYGGGYEVMVNLAKTRRSLLEGDQTKLFAPFDMRNGSGTILAKSDTRDMEREVIVEETIERRLNEQFAERRAIDKLKSAKSPEPAAAKSAAVAVKEVEDDGMEP